MTDEKDNYNDLIAAMYRIVGAAERRFDALREADKEAVRNALSALDHRLNGFPELYATKSDMAEAAKTLQRLERDFLSREIYEKEHSLLKEAVSNKLSASIFQAFAESYRTEQARLADERGDYLSQEYYDQRHESLVQQVVAVERWQYKLVGGLVFATFVAPLVTGLIVFIITNGII